MKWTSHCISSLSSDLVFCSILALFPQWLSISFLSPNLTLSLEWDPSSPSSMIFDNRLSKLSIGGDGSIMLCSFNVQTCSSRKPDNLRGANEESIKSPSQAEKTSKSFLLGLLAVITFVFYCLCWRLGSNFASLVGGIVFFPSMVVTNIKMVLVCIYIYQNINKTGVGLCHVWFCLK